MAPLREPADWIVWQTASQMRMNDTAPLDLLPSVRMRAPRGRSVEKSMPIPPPIFIVSAAYLAASMIPAMSSGIGGLTKQLWAVTFLSVPIAACTLPAKLNRRSISI